MSDFKAQAQELLEEILQAEERLAKIGEEMRQRQSRIRQARADLKRVMSGVANPVLFKYRRRVFAVTPATLHSDIRIDEATFA